MTGGFDPATNPEGLQLSQTLRSCRHPADKRLEQGAVIVRIGNLEMYKGMQIVDRPTSPITSACARCMVAPR